MEAQDIFYIRKENIYAVPVIHYNMECAAQVRQAFLDISPDCTAVELPQTMQDTFLQAASRLPDTSIAVASKPDGQWIYYMCEPCDGSFEALRSGLEAGIPAFCIDLDVDGYPDIRDHMPDPYAIHRIGLAQYYHLYLKTLPKHTSKTPLDNHRELFMARKLKELALRYDKVFFVCGMTHLHSILQLIDNSSFPDFKHAPRESSTLCALTEESSREIMAECGWMSSHYEEARQSGILFPPDRQKLIYALYKRAAEAYIEKTGNNFPGYHFRNIMKFVRNYAYIYDRLMPDLFQLLTAAKACVDPNYAYETWVLATNYPHQKNVDNLQELDLSIEEVWGKSKHIRFQLLEKNKKNSFFQRKKKDSSHVIYKPPSPFTICSFPPEDLSIERFGNFLKKKGTQILTDEAARTQPFSSSIEDGIDTRETIRHWHEKKLYVKVRGKPPGGVGSIVVIFDEDKPETGKEKYPWRTTWLGEHQQESDMSLYATSPLQQIVGPGISRCEYGGFMMSYPPRRMLNTWTDPDYEDCRSKSEVLLMAAIDYAIQPVIVFVAAKPPRPIFKTYAARYGKKIVYIPIGQLSPITLNKIRAFHVLDNQSKRAIADEYIF